MRCVNINITVENGHALLLKECEGVGWEGGGGGLKCIWMYCVSFKIYSKSACTSLDSSTSQQNIGRQHCSRMLLFLSTYTWQMLTRFSGIVWNTIVQAVRRIQAAMLEKIWFSWHNNAYLSEEPLCWILRNTLNKINKRENEREAGGMHMWAAMVELLVWSPARMSLSKTFNPKLP